MTDELLLVPKLLLGNGPGLDDQPSRSPRLRRAFPNRIWERARPVLSESASLVRRLFGGLAEGGRVECCNSIEMSGILTR